MSAGGTMRGEVRERVERFVDDLMMAGVATHVEAVVVSGSAARGEEVWRDGRLISDIDVMVVTRSESLRLARRISEVLARHAPAGLEGGRVPLRALRTYQTLEYFEARARGRTIFGDGSLLREIGIASAAELPAWEAVRILFNRLFEYAKVAVGSTSPRACVIKSYQAMGEAQLTVEGRYRPSFAERIAEAERRPLTGRVPGLQERYLRSYAARTCEDVALEETPYKAAYDLRLLLESVLPTVTGRNGGLPSQLEALRRRERHLKHRLFWAGITFPHSASVLRELQCDPILRLWQNALAFLETGCGDPHKLLSGWQRCPQIYRVAAPREPWTTMRR